MLITDLIVKVKTNLNIADTSKDLIINDVLQEVMNYCNLPKVPVEVSAERLGITVAEAYDLIELPAELEPFVRKKVQGIINYEAENGTSVVFDVKSTKEGDTSITYNTDEISKETIYGLSNNDKKALQRFRRMRK
ncbi:MAG: DNA-packaging protein [Clostridia bacterium]|nr:DNA-packaging protein [Clostridia bacterium]